jgi:hypothetical protein
MGSSIGQHHNDAKQSSHKSTATSGDAAMQVTQE